MDGEYEHITAGIPVVNPEYQSLGATGLKLECSASITDLLRDAFQSSQGGARALSRFWVNFMSCVGGTRKLARTCWNCRYLYFRKHSKKDRRYNKGLHKAGLWSCRKTGFIGWDCPGNDWCQCQGEYFRRKAKSKGDKV